MLISSFLFNQASLLVLLFKLSLQAGGGMWPQERGEKRQTTPWLTKQRPRKPLRRGTLTDWRRWTAKEKETGQRGEEGEPGSHRVIKNQEEGEWRMVDPQSRRRLMDKRACKSMLGGQTHCQTCRHIRCMRQKRRMREHSCSWMEKSSFRAHLANCMTHIMQGCTFKSSSKTETLLHAFQLRICRGLPFLNQTWI